MNNNENNKKQYKIKFVLKEELIKKMDLKTFKIFFFCNSWCVFYLNVEDLI